MSQSPSIVHSPPAYFPALDTLRLYAAICVIVDHVAALSYFDQPARVNAGAISLFFLSGADAVTLFFVLSGFLITYLLLRERTETQTISVRRFYMRRALRILPLYFLLIALTVVVIVLLGYQQYLLPTMDWAWMLLLFLSPHIPNALIGLGAFGHFWSIGVEEWFYFAYPPLFRRLSLLFLIVTVIVVRLLIGTVYLPEFTGFAASEQGGAWITLFGFMRFECMAIGALGAWIFVYRAAWLPGMYRLEIPCLLIIGAVIVLGSGATGALYHIVLSVVFMIAILSIATNPRSLLRWRIKPFEALGKRTYGIYMYHVIAILLVARLLDVTGLEMTALNLPILYVGSVMLSIAIALLSYHFFEQRFLKMKDRYSSRQPTSTPAYAAGDASQKRSDGLEVQVEIS